MAVLIELERRAYELAYVRTQTGCEVDFLATNPEGKRTYIQVCSDLSTAEIRKRELRPFAELQLPRNKAGFLLLALMAGDVSLCQKGGSTRRSRQASLEVVAGRRNLACLYARGGKNPGQSGR